MITGMNPRYPVGKFVYDPSPTPAKRRAWIADLDALPANVQAVLETMSPAALDTPYREGGWTARQVVHHLADSHLNAYTRIRLALTEAAPMMKTYDEKGWAELPDARQGDPAPSLLVLRGLHARLTLLLEGLDEAQLARPARHPQWGEVTVDYLVQAYAWHSRHHLGHLTLARDAAAAAAAR